MMLAQRPVRTCENSTTARGDVADVIGTERGNEAIRDRLSMDL
jgi:hypothetical protein